VARILVHVRFQDIMVASTKMTAFWDTALCSLLGEDRRFRDAYIIRAVDLFQRDYTALFPRMLSYSALVDV
jgi:hypothetical protein